MRFFPCSGPYTVSALIETAGAQLLRGDDTWLISDVASLADAGPGDVSFYASTTYRDDLDQTKAGLILTREALADHIPDNISVAICKDPARAFESLVRQFFPTAGIPASAHGTDGISPGAHVHASAHVEAGASVEPGASVGAGAQIGADTIVHSGAVIGAGVCIGRGCSIGPGASVINAHLGDRVILHPGVRIGQDGFGYSPGPKGLDKVFHVGKVVIQDDVEIGANSCVDRGGVRDTVIGEGTKIDNLVQIAHNVVVGRHCIIVSLSALAGSVTLGDGVVVAGSTMVNNHVKIASGSRILALSAVKDDITQPGDYGGVPARPARQWLSEHMMSLKIARERIAAAKAKGRRSSAETKDD